MDSQTVMEVLGELEKLYPQAGAELNFTNPFETVIATVLAAQCTDKRAAVCAVVVRKLCRNAA